MLNQIQSIAKEYGQTQQALASASAEGARVKYRERLIELQAEWEKVAIPWSEVQGTKEYEFPIGSQVVWIKGSIGLQGKAVGGFPGDARMVLVNTDNGAYVEFT